MFAWRFLVLVFVFFLFGFFFLYNDGCFRAASTIPFDLDVNLALKQKLCSCIFCEQFIIIFGNTNLISLVIVKQELYKKYL